MVNIRRRFFLFGAVAAAAPIINKKIFILPPVQSVRIFADFNPLGDGKWVELWTDPMQAAAYRHAQLIKAEVDRKILEALSGIPDILRGNDVPDDDRYAVVPAHFARRLGIDVDSAGDYADVPLKRAPGDHHGHGLRSDTRRAGNFLRATADR
jgi:hypothetical protein